MKIICTILVALCFFGTASYSSLKKLQPEKSSIPVPEASTKKTTAPADFSGNSANDDEKKGYLSEQYGLKIDGIFVGWLHSVEGGDVKSGVVLPITFTCETGMSKDFYQLIKDSWVNTNTRKNGAVIFTDHNYKEDKTLSFTNGLISEVGFPALDAASKDAAKMTVKIRPEKTENQKGNGGSYADAQSAIHKIWLCSNFRLNIDGLDDVCAKVSKIDALVIKQRSASSAGENGPTFTEYPNLVITLPENQADKFFKWQDDFVVKGKNKGLEKGGKLEYLDEKLQNVLFTLTFHNLRIFKVTKEKDESKHENKVKCEMSIEKINFDFKD